MGRSAARGRCHERATEATLATTGGAESPARFHRKPRQTSSGDGEAEGSPRRWLDDTI